MNAANVAALESGLLRFAETTLYGGLVAGMQAMVPLLTTPSVSAVDWNSVVHTFLAAMLVATLSGVKTYHTALAIAPSDGSDTSLGPLDGPAAGV